MEKRKTASSQNKMGTMNILPLIFNMSFPMMVAMLVQSLYNVVDSVFVAMISEDALTAVSLAFPVQNLMISFAVGTAIGVCTMMATRLGEGKKESVDRYAMQGVFLAIVTSVVFAILGFLIIDPFLSRQTSDPTIQSYGRSYLKIVMTVGIGGIGGVMADRLLQATGRTALSMVAQLSGAITNIILDPIFIFGFLFVPKMGVAGAAIATVIGQIVGLIVSINLNLKHNHDVVFRIKGIAPIPHALKNIYKIAVPSILVSSIMSVVVFVLNIILGAFTKTAIAVYGVYFKLQSFIFMPTFGLVNGVVPIIAYNFGAKNKKRIISTVKSSIIIAFSIMVFGTVVFEVFPRQLLALFSAGSDMERIGVHCLRRIALCFCSAAIGVVTTGALQSLGHATYSAIVSFMRQAVALIPAAYLLSLTGDVNNVWWAFPIAEFVSLIVSLSFSKRVYDKDIATLP